MSSEVCQMCQKRLENMILCEKCGKTYYCSKDHQRSHWKKHKNFCKKHSLRRILETNEKPSEITANMLWRSSNVLSEQSRNGAIPRPPNPTAQSSPEPLKSPHTSEVPKPQETAQLPESAEGPLAPSADASSLFPLNSRPFLRRRYGLSSKEDRLLTLNRIVTDLNNYGVVVIDNFLGETRGMRVLQEVVNMHRTGGFSDGELVSNPGDSEAQKFIRSDQIKWINGREPDCVETGNLIRLIDSVLKEASELPNSGELGRHKIQGRTKAMVACYPGGGTHYVKHVDNPNQDGRCVTAIYYLNRDWDIETCGGLLRIFPSRWEDRVANIAPYFDRLLFFWSDRRNPHEVQPAFKTRYAITLWYFDYEEKKAADGRKKKEEAARGAPTSSSAFSEDVDKGASTSGTE